MLVVAGLAPAEYEPLVRSCRRLPGLRGPEVARRLGELNRGLQDLYAAHRDPLREAVATASARFRELYVREAGALRIIAVYADEIWRLAGRLGVDMPISEQVYGIIHKGRDPNQSVRELLAREPKSETA